MNDTSLRRVRTCLKLVFVLGLLLVLFDPLWLPVIEAARVDQILTPNELRDSELIEVAYRTQSAVDGKLVFPYRVFGVAVILLAVVALVSMKNCKTT